MLWVIEEKHKQTQKQKQIFDLYMKSLKIPKGGNQNPYIEEEQTTQWPKEKVQKYKKSLKVVNGFFLFKIKNCIFTTILLWVNSRIIIYDYQYYTYDNVYGTQ